MIYAKPINPVVVDTLSSPSAQLSSIPLNAVKLTDNFWAPRLQTLREVTLPEQYQRCEETGRIDNFRRAAGKVDKPFQGRVYDDSDVYKWLEAVGWVLAYQEDPHLEELADGVAEIIIDAQRKNGYLNTYFSLEQIGERWQNLRDNHELYCAGHFIQSAIAHQRAGRGDQLLGAAIRLANHIHSTFGPEETGKRRGVPGHEEIEIALVELSRTTRDRKYLQLAKFFIDERGKGLIGGRAYHQDRIPFRQMKRLEGHAVRALYLCAGAADVYSEMGDLSLLESLERLWGHMTEKQIYISGGLGALHWGESFGEDYELPNIQAYAETCAAVAAVMLNWRLLALRGEARFADTLEWTLYNAVLSGISLDGKAYFYNNPLADLGTHRRKPWFACACCPTNLARLLASLPGYFYSYSEEGIWIHLFSSGKTELSTPEGRALTLVQSTNYPWDGVVELEIQGKGTFSLFIRIPKWCSTGARLEINGISIKETPIAGTYAQILRSWKTGDVIRLDLPMPVQEVISHAYVMENTSKIALTRGPLLYCIEGVDHHQMDLRNLILPTDATYQIERHPDLLGDVDVVTLQSDAIAQAPTLEWEGQLYRPYEVNRYQDEVDQINLTAVPYYAWANRAPGGMRVWIRKFGLNEEIEI
ncbi:MAG: glycoside hydrolase family 127 protein [Anaerolineales bacterium]|jgi:hypothetical protein